MVLARKFLVLAIGVFLANNTFGLQVTACMWVVTAATVLQLLCKPYQHRTEERLETLSLGGMTVAMMIGLFSSAFAFQQSSHFPTGSDGNSNFPFRTGGTSATIPSPHRGATANLLTLDKASRSSTAFCS